MSAGFINRFGVAQPVRSSTHRRIRRGAAHRLLALAATAGTVGLTQISRAETFGANGGTPLNVGSSWIDETGSSVNGPGATDIAQWDSNDVGNFVFTLGGSVSWGEIKVTNLASAATINNDSNTLNLVGIGGTGLDMSSATTSLTLNNSISLGSVQTWTIGSAATLNIGGAISDNGDTLTIQGGGTANISGSLNGGGGLTKGGSGTLTLSGANTYSGATTISRGTLVLDFSSGAIATNIINSTSALQFSGGNLVMNNGASSASPTQTFASTQLGAGANSIAITNTGTGTPVLNLSAINASATATNAPAIGGTVEFVGAATDTGTGGTYPINPVPAVGKIETTSGAASAILNVTATGSAWAGSQNAAYATVGLYDWAAKDPTNAFIVGGSQITGFYTSASGGSYSATVGNLDITGNITSFHNTITVSSMRFNTPAATSAAAGSTVVASGGILITPNMGTNNVTLSGSGGLDASRNSGIAGELVLWQDNTLGEFLLSDPIIDSKVAGQNVVQAGPGTIVISGTGSYTGQTYLNGGVTEITTNAAIGAPVTGAQVNINGGALVGGANITLDSSGSDKRNIVFNGGGGNLAAITGTTTTVDGIISGSGPVTFGYGTLPGTGAGTANANAVVGNGVVILSAQTPTPATPRS